MVDWRTWIEAAGATGVDVDSGPGFNHSHLVTAAAINGDGVALGRSALVTDAIERGELIKPFELSLPCSFAYYAVCSHGSADDPVVMAFRDWLIEEGGQSQVAQDAIARRDRPLESVWVSLGAPVRADNRVPVITPD